MGASRHLAEYDQRRFKHRNLVWIMFGRFKG